MSDYFRIKNPPMEGVEYSGGEPPVALPEGAVVTRNVRRKLFNSEKWEYELHWYVPNKPDGG